MALPYNLRWNDNFEELLPWPGSGISIMHDYNVFNEFASAFRERMCAVSGICEFYIAPTISGVATMGYNLGTIVNASSGVPSARVINPTYEYITADLNTGFRFPPFTIGGIEPEQKPGANWAGLQRNLVRMAQFFVDDTLDYSNLKNYFKSIVSAPSSFGSMFIYDVLPESGSSSPYGIQSLTPIMNSGFYSPWTSGSYPNPGVERGIQIATTTVVQCAEGITTAFNVRLHDVGNVYFGFENNFLTSYPRINGMAGYNLLDSSGNRTTNIYKDYYYIDKFPKPSGFRRKYPREIYSTTQYGEDGWYARFSYRRNLGLAGGFFGTNVNDIIYGSGVITPSNEIFNSGKIFKYISASGGWILWENQYQEPDIVNDYGLIHPGDYMGPWILNDLRDAINSMVYTFGVYVTPSIPVSIRLTRGLSIPNYPNFGEVSLLNKKMYQYRTALPTFYILSGSGNIRNGNTGTLFDSINFSSNAKLPIAQSMKDIDGNCHYSRSNCVIFSSGLFGATAINKEIDYYSITDAKIEPAYISLVHRIYYDNNGDIGEHYPTEYPSKDMYVNQTYFSKYIGTTSWSGSYSSPQLMLGDPLLTIPNEPMVSGEFRGYQTDDVFAICRWNVPGGFIYTSGKLD